MEGLEEEGFPKETECTRARRGQRGLPDGPWVFLWDAMLPSLPCRAPQGSQRPSLSSELGLPGAG